MIEYSVLFLSVAALPYLIHLIAINFLTRKSVATFPDVYPPISVIISAYNEEDNIAWRISNLVACRYPDMEIIVIDDCSSDYTYNRAREALELANIPHKIMKNGTRLGVSASYNIAITNAKNEIVVATDADTLFASTALHRIVARLISDNRVGAVTGDLQPLDPTGIVLPMMEADYRSMYGKMCMWESDFDSTFNFNGALMAFRKSAIVHDKSRSFNQTYIDAAIGADDANIAFATIRNGFRAVYEKGAIVYERIPTDPRIQMRQKIRRAGGLLKAMYFNRDLLFMKRDFAKTFAVRMWMYFISPLAFFIGMVFAFMYTPLLPILVMLSMLLSFPRAFVLNQFYLVVGLLSIRKDTRIWESTSSLEVI